VPAAPSVSAAGTRLRHATPADLEALLPLVADFHAHEALDTAPETRRAAMGRLLREPQRGRVVLLEDPSLAGYGVVAFGYSIEFGGVYAFVDELYVRPERRGKGLGTRLLDRLEDEARQAGSTAVHLEVADVNARAQRLYERRGYRLHGRRLMTRPLG
jgi:ribosomal protein S18 acetylase RimI-like enzyme